MDPLEEQAEEIEVLKSIYPDELESKGCEYGWIIVTRLLTISCFG